MTETIRLRPAETTVGHPGIQCGALFLSAELPLGVPAASFLRRDADHGALGRRALLRMGDPGRRAAAGADQGSILSPTPSSGVKVYRYEEVESMFEADFARSRQMQLDRWSAALAPGGGSGGLSVRACLVSVPDHLAREGAGYHHPAPVGGTPDHAAADHDAMLDPMLQKIRSPRAGILPPWSSIR